MKTLFIFFILFAGITACNKSATTVPEPPAANMHDTDGNKYTIVRIGGRDWLKQNLTVSRYRNGAVIPKVSDPAVWSSLTTGAWCWYNNDSVSYAAVYGKLYNWYAVNDPRGLAPAGWHIPDEMEWTALSGVLGGNSVSGGSLKETGIEHWMSPNMNATNASGFTGLPSGFRNYDGSFNGLGYSGIIWTSSPFDLITAYARELVSYSTALNVNQLHKNDGFSIRCVKD